VPEKKARKSSGKGMAQEPRKPEKEASTAPSKTAEGPASLVGKKGGIRHPAAPPRKPRWPRSAKKSTKAKRARAAAKWRARNEPPAEQT
jgi:hypothetical protein